MELENGSRIRLTDNPGSWPEIAKPGMEGVVINTRAGGRDNNYAVDLDGIPRWHGPFGEGFWFTGNELEVIQ